MANFNPAFSTSADFRMPTSDERQNGFPCGPADRELFNGLFHRIEAELGNVIVAAGITPSDDSFTQVLEAIEAIISTATGGNPAGYILMDQARARLPIYPDVQNADGRINITSPANGSIRVPGGVTFQHRGIFPVTTAQTDFPTVASKIYHLRWNPTDGFTLRDLADVTYNPSTLNETNEAFDSGFDDMLVARIVTNASNVPTITNLANKDRLWLDYFTTITTGWTSTPNDNAIHFNAITIPLNFARRARSKNVQPVVGATGTGTGSQNGLDGIANYHTVTAESRYGFTINATSDFAGPVTGPYLNLRANFGA